MGWDETHSINQRPIINPPPLPLDKPQRILILPIIRQHLPRKLALTEKVPNQIRNGRRLPPILNPNHLRREGMLRHQPCQTGLQPLLNSSQAVHDRHDGEIGGRVHGEDVRQDGVVFCVDGDGEEVQGLLDFDDCGWAGDGDFACGYGSCGEVC